MTVDEMLQRMTASEFARWIAYYGDKSSARQTPDQIKAGLIQSLAARAARKKKNHAA